MKGIKHLVVLFTIAVVSVSVKAAVEKGEPPARFDFVRPLGMGGAFTAVADDHNIFNFNPAGMVQRTGGQLTILEVAGGVSDDTLDALDFVEDNEDDLTRFDDPTLTAARRQQLVDEIIQNISPLDPRAYLAADIASYVSGPSFWGMPFHVGFGAFGIVDSSFRLDVGPSQIPQITYDIHNDVVIPLSLAKRFENIPLVPGKLGFGVTAKAISRRRVKEERKSVLFLEDFDPPIAEGFGIGMDVGVLHQVTGRFNWGLMVRDFLGTKMSFDPEAAKNGFVALPERDTVIRPRTNVGISIVPKSLLFLFPTTDRWTFSADIRDVLNKDDHLLFENGLRKPFGEDLWTHVHLGTEFRYWFLRFRGGAHQGYPTFGLGVDIPFIKVDYAYYGIELGDQAGDRRQDNHVVSLAFRFGSGHVEARERIIKAKEAKKEKKMAEPDEVPEAEPAEPEEEETSSDTPSEEPASEESSEEEIPE